MNKSENRKIGDLGEEIACKYLESKGYRVFTRNYWRPWGEIDIIANFPDGLHFIEVKTVTRETFDERAILYRPEENVHKAKLDRMARIIQTYLAENPTDSWKFDVITVLLDQRGKRAKVEMIENIILGG